ncbi:MAG: hypothetical protein V1923_04690, partial [Candidatus Omnitrophota bacterium]
MITTNSFRLPNTSAQTLKICASLLEKGIDFYSLTEMVYWSHSREELILSKVCLERAHFLIRGRIVWSLIKSLDFRGYGGRDSDVDAVADEMRAIKGVQIAVLFRQKSR